METARALIKSDSMINQNRLELDAAVNIPLEWFIGTIPRGISVDGRKSVFKKGKDREHIFLDKSLGAIAVSDTDNWKDSELGVWLTAAIATPMGEMVVRVKEEVTEWLDSIKGRNCCS